VIKYKFSLITPTHRKSPYLLELYETIKAQDYKNWEWILWLNNGITLEDVPTVIQEDERVEIFTSKEDNNNIGYIKRNAFSQGRGEILVEVDHDDLLTSDCLSELNLAFQDTEIGFAYSDNAKLDDNFIPYRSDQGWKHGRFKWKDKSLIYMKGFSPSSQAMSTIYFAPDHVRAWRSTVYNEVGGHNLELDVCDDYELVVRTYLISKFYYIPKVLYIYRIDGNNSWLQNTTKIRDLSVETFQKYAFRLAEKDAELKGLLKVDLGGGVYPYQGYMTVDKEDADICCDLDKGIPLEDNSVGVLRASHIIEHLKDPIKTMREIHRVLCHGGWAMIEVPSTDGRGAWMDPTHVSYWNENSFLYYTDMDQAQFIRNTDIRFQSYRLETHFPSPFYKRMEAPCVTTWLSCVKTGPRLPGGLRI
jgi:glycosyltransferase involved in cell wall biosynthesis